MITNRIEILKKRKRNLIKLTKCSNQYFFMCIVRNSNKLCKYYFCIFPFSFVVKRKYLYIHRKNKTKSDKRQPLNEKCKKKKRVKLYQQIYWFPKNFPARPLTNKQKYRKENEKKKIRIRKTSTSVTFRL